MVAGLYLGHKVAEMTFKKAEEKTQNTEITTTERVGYTVSPIIQGATDLLQGDSLETVAEKNMKTMAENVNTVKEVAKDVAKDVAEGSVPKWALPFTGLIGLAVNLFD